MAIRSSKNVLELAMRNPSRIYRTPMDVVRDDRTTLEEKQKILKNWELDQQRLLDSDAENMGDGMPSGRAAKMLQDISNAKEVLEK